MHPQTGQYTPSQIAEMNGHKKIVKYLDATRGFSQLHFACEERNPAKLKMLLRNNDTDIYARSAGFGKKTYTASASERASRLQITRADSRPRSFLAAPGARRHR